MVRWLTTCMVMALLLPLGAEAQQLKVLASGTSLTVTAKTSSSYIEVTGTAAQGPFMLICKPNVACGTLPTGASSVSSRLVYNNTRERLTGCNGEAPTSEGSECMRADGILTASLQVRTGKLKISAKPADGYGGLLLNTVSKGVRLEFAESSEHAWSHGYSNSNFGAASQWQTVAAGNYRVYADDLAAHCDPTQTNVGAALHVPEGSTVEDALEFVVLFRAQNCEVKVARSAGTNATLREVASDPPGLDCPPGSATCTGIFPYGTDLKLTPVGSYSWAVGEGCQPTNAPCTKKITSDRSFSLTFNAGSSSAQDAGAEGDAGSPTDDDASADDPDPAADNDAGSDAEEDAGASSSSDGEEQESDDDTDEPQEDDAGAMDEEESGGGKNDCSVSPTGRANVASALIALGTLACLWVRRRQARARS